LRVNQKKVELWKVPTLERHRLRHLQSIFAKKGDNKDPRKVREFARQYLAIPRAILDKSWNSGLPALNRLVWANIESLPHATFEKLVARFTTKKYLLRAEHDKLRRVYDLNKL